MVQAAASLRREDNQNFVRRKSIKREIRKGVSYRKSEIRKGVSQSLDANPKLW